MTQTIRHEERLDIEAEIVSHLWHEVQATPLTLAGVLRRPLPILLDCLDDLSGRGFVYQFLSSPEGRDRSIYCLTRAALKRIEWMLQGYSRYRLKSAWDVLRQERLRWLTPQEPG